MSDPSNIPFRRDQFLVGGKLSGARWWQTQLRQPPGLVARRAILMAVAAGAGVTLLAGGCLVAVAASSDNETEEEAIEAQKKYGWSVGSEAVPLTYGSEASGKFDQATLLRLATELAPRQQRLLPFYVPTLFQSITSNATVPGSGVASPLRDVLRPATTQAMTTAFERGKSFSSLFQGAPTGKAIIVDLPGPEAVAFAAGLADRFEPVFLFDNWPHPLGVVPAHLTLGAAATMLADFQAAAAKRPSNAPPIFVLDRNRLTPYTDDSEKFDNRYLARTPPTTSFATWGISQILYVVPTAVETDGDDLNQDFVAYSAAEIDIKTVAATDFREAEATAQAPVNPATKDAGAPKVAAATPLYPYGGSTSTHIAFWQLYGWGTPAVPFRTPTNVSRGYAFRPVARATPFSSIGTSVKTRPEGFGKVNVVTERSSGRLVGVKSGRSGSYGRGSWSGG